MSNNQLQSSLSMKINEEDIEITTMEDDLNSLAGQGSEKNQNKAPVASVPAQGAGHGFSFFGGTAAKPSVTPNVAPKSTSPFLTDTPVANPASAASAKVTPAPAQPTVAVPVEKKKSAFSFFGGNKAKKLSLGVAAPVKSAAAPQGLPVKNPAMAVKTSPVAAAAPIKRESQVNSFFGGDKAAAVKAPAMVNAAGAGVGAKEGFGNNASIGSKQVPELPKLAPEKKKSHWYSFFGGEKKKTDKADAKIIKPATPAATNPKITPTAFGSSYHPTSPAPSSLPHSSSDMKHVANTPAREVPIKIPTPVISASDKEKKPQVGTTITGKKPVKMGLNWGLIGIVAIIIAIIAVGAGGGYYYWATRRPVTQPIVVTQSIIEEQPRITVPDSKFSEDMPNYLNIDVETSSVESIKALLTQTAQEVSDSGLKKPVEFLVRDQNNNPIAFTRFAYIFQLNLSANVLVNMEEDFSLFFYNDNNLMHLGLAVELLDQEEAALGLAKEEGTIVQSFLPIFLDKSVNGDVVKFSSGKYGEQATRYANLNADNSVSFDYAIVGKKLVIGTSMLTARAIIDKVAASAVVVPAVVPSVDNESSLPATTIDVDANAAPTEPMSYPSSRL